ncbi:hypothetical protein STEG23_026564, partial [Scotinomys teguina]
MRKTRCSSHRDAYPGISVSYTDLLKNSILDSGKKNHSEYWWLLLAVALFTQERTWFNRCSVIFTRFIQNRRIMATAAISAADDRFLFKKISCPRLDVDECSVHLTANDPPCLSIIQLLAFFLSLEIKQ